MAGHGKLCCFGLGGHCLKATCFCFVLFLQPVPDGPRYSNTFWSNLHFKCSRFPIETVQEASCDFRGTMGRSCLSEEEDVNGEAHLDPWLFLI